MKFTRILIKGINFIYCLWNLKSIQLAYLLVYYKVDLACIKHLAVSGDQLVFKKTGNTIFIKQLPLFGFLVHMLFDLLENESVKVVALEESYFIVEVHNLKFKVASLSNMAVLYEIFIQKIYDITLTSQNIIVLDIGMNVGVASHYFASMPNVKAVYGFEPFPETFEEAVFNASLNAHLALNIIRKNSGVSDTSATKSIPLFESGSLSASTTEQQNTFGKIPGKYISIDLIAAKEILSDIISRYPDSRLMLKIDCEGEEYAIFESLQHTQLLDSVDCILVEWHEKGAAPITKFLEENGFQFHHIPNETLNCGMIYAFKLNSK